MNLSECGLVAATFLFAFLPIEMRADQCQDILQNGGGFNEDLFKNDSHYRSATFSAMCEQAKKNSETNGALSVPGYFSASGKHAEDEFRSACSEFGSDTQQDLSQFLYRRIRDKTTVDSWLQCMKSRSFTCFFVPTDDPTKIELHYNYPLANKAKITVSTLTGGTAVAGLPAVGQDLQNQVDQKVIVQRTDLHTGGTYTLNAVDQGNRFGCADTFPGLPCPCEMHVISGPNPNEYANLDENAVKALDVASYYNGNRDQHFERLYASALVFFCRDKPTYKLLRNGQVVTSPTLNVDDKGLGIQRVFFVQDDLDRQDLTGTWSVQASESGQTSDTACPPAVQQTVTKVLVNGP